MTGELPESVPSPAGSRGLQTYNPTRRTALVLIGEGTSAAYLAGALKALGAAGVRIDLILGKGVGAVVAAFGAIQSSGKLLGEGGLLTALHENGTWRLRAPYRLAAICLAVAFAVFISPALLAVLLLVALPFIAAARIVAPDAVASLFGSIQEQIATFSAELDPIYLRAMAFPIAILFAVLLVGWLLPGLARRSAREAGLGRFFGDGFIQISPFSQVLERKLWEAVRGASTEARPAQLADMGLCYRDLLSASLGQPGFSELIFYALDVDTGQEVPFVLLKDRWLTRLARRGPGAGALVSEPVSLAGESGPLLFDALTASVSPPGLAPGVPLRLPLVGRHAGEVHRFASSLLTGHSTIADAMSAGAEQVIYVSGSPASNSEERAIPAKLSAAAVRQSLENDLRWADQAGLTVFTVRPEKPRLGLFEFAGRALPGGDRLQTAALAAHGERDAFRLFVRPFVGEMPSGPPGGLEGARGQPGVSSSDDGARLREDWGPREFD
jgi:hypothetical protein